MFLFYNGGFEAVFSLIFLVIAGIAVVTVIRSIGQWNRNNHSPRLTVLAAVVAKRTSVTSNPGTDQMAGSTTTWYYATFQVESGDRMEFSLKGREYGMLAEGDQGKLTFQGTRYLGFERT